MPRFFFNLVGPHHLTGPHASGRDGEGADCATLAAACDEARKAIIHISLRILEEHGRPELMSFDILDESHLSLTQVSFAEVLRGMRRNSVPASKWFDRDTLRDQLRRCLALQRDVEADIAQAHLTVESLRAGGRLPS